MEFRLIYEGPLPSNGNATIKHAIRKKFHGQLKELWATHRFLQLMKERVTLEPGFTGSTFLNALARRFKVEGFHFVPLVNNVYGLICGLDILFLRKGKPGDLVMPGGDIDNRIKTLLDALRMPHNQNEIGDTPDAEEEPFFCLVEDDALITEVNITTDRLLTTVKSESRHPQNDVFLVIRVSVKAAEPLTLGNLTMTEIGKYL